MENQTLIDVLVEQRNAAWNTAAQWEAQARLLAGEKQSLTAEVEALKAQPCDAAPTTHSDEAPHG